MSEKTMMWCVKCQRQPDTVCAADKHPVEPKWPNGDPLGREEREPEIERLAGVLNVVREKYEAAEAEVTRLSSRLAQQEKR